MGIAIDLVLFGLWGLLAIATLGITVSTKGIGLIFAGPVFAGTSIIVWRMILWGILP